MSENGSSKWIVIGCVGLALVSVCCVSGGSVAWFAYVRQEQEEAQRVVREMQLEQTRMEREAELAAEEARRAAEAARNRALLAPPPPLGAVPERTSDRRPRRIEATVTRADGASGLSVGQRCEFEVTVHDRDNAVGYWCRALVECAGIRLYGEDRPDGTGNGYFGCALWRRPRGVAGEDRETSASGSDPFFQIDTRAGTFVVIDDAESTLRPGAYRVEAAIGRVR